MKRNNLIILAMMVAWSTDSYSMKRPSPETPSTQAQDTSKRPRMADDEPQEEIVLSENEQEEQELPPKTMQKLPSEKEYGHLSFYQRLGFTGNLKSHKNITLEEVENRYSKKLNFFRENNASEKLISLLDLARKRVLQEVSERVLREASYKDSSYYARLGLWKDAHLLGITDEQLDQAYQRKLAQLEGKEGSPYMIQLLKQAYETLKNPEKKAQYDRGLQREKTTATSSSSSEPFAVGSAASMPSMELRDIVMEKALPTNNLKVYKGQNFYQRLGLDSEQKHLITQQDIEAAYRNRKKAIIANASLNEDVKTQFIALLEEAYTTLSFPGRRDFYDDILATHMPATELLNYENQNFYERLGLDFQQRREITQENIKKAYNDRKKTIIENALLDEAVKAEFIALLEEAYTTLSFPGRKSFYDDILEQPELDKQALGGKDVPPFAKQKQSLESPAVSPSSSSNTAPISQSRTSIVKQRALATGTPKTYKDQNYYRRLGLNSKQKHLITQQDIHDAYFNRKKAINEMGFADETKDKFIFLLERAYKTLSAPAFRAAYDARLDQLELNKKQKKLDKRALVEQEDMPVLEPAEE